MRQINTLFISLAALFLTACSAETSHFVAAKDNTEGISHLQHHWTLVAIDTLPVKASILSTLNVDQEAQATGNLACNNFFGVLEVQDKYVRISPIGSTRKMCSEQINEVERQVMSVLADWFEVQSNADTLTLIGKDHRLSYKLNE